LKPKKPLSKKRKKTQHEKFVELARESGADESEDTFVTKIRAISSIDIGEKPLKRKQVMGWSAHLNTIDVSLLTGICLVESPQIPGKPGEPKAGDVWSLEFADNSRGQATVLKAEAAEISVEIAGNRWMLAPSTAAEAGINTPGLDSTNWKVIAALT
jgi:hypothetical protein